MKDDSVYSTAKMGVSVMDEEEDKLVMVVKFKSMMTKIMEEENTTVLYPYSTTSGGSQLPCPQVRTFNDAL